MTAPRGTEDATYRYGVVLALLLVLVAFSIVAPTATWSRAIGFALEVSALVVTVATSRAARAIRGRRATIVAVVGAVLVAAVALRTIPVALTFAISGLISAAIPVALAGGVVRLLRDRGVTIQAVAGALSVYLLVGLLFAWIISFIAKVQGSPYFVQQHGVDTSTATYYSFTVMTTTGLGDLTAATRVGRALAVMEMLIGQIYVVVVIGLLVGNVAGRRRVAGSEAQPPAEGA
jgi:Ion channel